MCASVDMSGLCTYQLLALPLTADEVPASRIAEDDASTASKIRVQLENGGGRVRMTA